MKKILIPTMCLAVLAGTFSCNSSDKKAAEEENATCDSITVDTTDSMFGTYYGTLPCADCGGKKVALSIKDDKTYNLTYEYLDSEDEGEMEDNGVYNLINDTIIEIVTPSSGVKTYYAYSKGNMVLSDSVGTINTGELADFYVLKKDTLAAE